MTDPLTDEQINTLRRDLDAALDIVEHTLAPETWSATRATMHRALLELVALRARLAELETKHDDVLYYAVMPDDIRERWFPSNASENEDE